tara:strand:+ start:6032 stop:7258 length:1227 start_codon:yes stop_codon:yes gene_type:complete
MKYKLSILLIIIYSSCIAQEGGYLISDINFRAFFLENHPEIMLNDSLININACEGVLELNCSDSQISNLDGIQFFENLTHLNCSYNLISKLVSLPSKITHLNASYCINLDTLGAFPSMLKVVNLSYNQIHELPNLPMTIERLFCSTNELSQLPYLPPSITHIDCSFNNLESLPHLPENLSLINCSYNIISELPDLPDNLGVVYNNPLSIFNNNIECVRNFSEVFLDLLGDYPQCEPTLNPKTQEIFLPTGWSMFSIYGFPSDQNIENIMNPHQSIIMIKDQTGQSYIEEIEFNSIGNIEVGNAYQIKVSEPTTLSIEMNYFEPETYLIPIHQGWNMIGYIRENEAPANLVLEPLIQSNNLLLAKDSYGNVLIPEIGYNGIGNMVPGKGYQLKVLNSDIMYFLPNSMNY